MRSTARRQRCWLRTKKRVGISERLPITTLPSRPSATQYCKYSKTKRMMRLAKNRGDDRGGNLFAAQSDAKTKVNPAGMMATSMAAQRCIDAIGELDVEWKVKKFNLAMWITADLHRKTHPGRQDPSLEEAFNVDIAQLNADVEP